jgi:hypothetical protein
MTLFVLAPQLIYIDLVKSALIKVPEGTPRINFVTSEMLDLLDYHDLKYTTNDGPEYGKLEVLINFYNCASTHFLYI